MRRTREPRQSVMSFKVTQEMRRTVELLAADLTIKRGSHHTLTDVVEEAIRLLAKKQGVKHGEEVC